MNNNQQQFTEILEAALQKRGLSLSDAYRQTSEYTPDTAEAVYQAAAASRLWDDEQVGKWLGCSAQVVRKRYKIRNK